MTSSVVASPSAALCSAAAEFNAAVAAIGNIDAAKVGIDGVKAALQNLQSAGRDLAGAAQAQFDEGTADHSARITAGHPRLVTDQTSLSTKLGALAASVAAVQQAATPILNSARAGCPPTPST